MRDVWQAADDIDLFDACWNFDHFEPILGKPRNGPCLEGWTVLAAMAAATRRVRLGVMVTGAPLLLLELLLDLRRVVPTLETVEMVKGGGLLIKVLG